MILELDGIAKKFGGLLALHGVSLGVEPGDIYGLIGPNGAGKTTLMNIISGIYKPNGGTITFRGTNITGWSPDKICRAGISRTFQISQPFPKMSALDTVCVAAAFGNAKPDKAPQLLAQEMLDFVEFPAPPETPAENLNTVQLKRLDLARALASHPKLLLLDELGAGLTPAELTDLMALIRRIRDTGVTIMVVEHLMKVIMGVCDKLAVLDFGEKIADGTPSEAARNPRVVEAYLGQQLATGGQEVGIA